MPLHKLSVADLARLTKKQTSTRVPNPYIAEIKSIKVGDGARVIVADEGLTRQGLKIKLTKAAKAAGVTIQYLRTGADEVVFKVVSKGTSG